MSVSEAVEAAKPPEDVRLRRNELSLRHIVTSTLANIAPAMSFFFGFAVIVQGAGIAAPLTILTAMIGILLLTNSTAEFSRFTPSAGSFVTFTGKALGPSIGAAISVFVLFGYIVAASTVVSVAGIWIAQIWGLVEPGQSWPFNIFPWVALAVSSWR
jgi:amino acid transporter